MTDDIIIPLLKDRLSGWTETPIKWPNEIFHRVDGVAYIRIEYFTSDAGFSALMSTLERSTGFIRATVFVPVFSGSERVGELSRLMCDQLKAWRAGGIRCLSGKVYPGPEQPIWLQRNVDIKFTYNQCLEV